MSNYDANLMDWDSAIESDGQQFIVLDEGDYPFGRSDHEAAVLSAGVRLHQPGHH